MAFQTGGKPVVKAGKTNATPAPVKTEAEARSTSWGRESYGSNGFSGASSVNPGQSVTSTLADELKRAGTDGVLDVVIAKGTGNVDRLGPAFGNSQERTDQDVKPYPTSHGMRNRNADANAKIPGALVGGQADPVRKPE